MRSNLLVSLLGRSVEVSCQAPDVEEWLCEMLRPGIDVDAGGHGKPSVVITDAPHPCPPDIARMEPAPSFALDSKVLFLPARAGSSSTLVADEDVGALYEVGDHEIRVRPYGEDPGLRVAAFRVLREVLVAQVLSSTCAQLHASGLASDPGAIAFIGPKGAGKTTTMSHLARETGAGILANDRLLVHRAAGGWRARAVPTIVSIRPGTASRLPMFEPQLKLGRTVHLTMAEVDLRAAAATKPDAPRMTITPAQLARLAGVRLAATAPLTCVALISRDPQVATFAVRPFSTTEAVAALTRQRFGTATPRPRTVFEQWATHDATTGPDTTRGPQTSAVEETAALHTIGTEVPCVELRVGPGLLSTHGAAEQLLDALAGSRVPS